MRKYYTKFFWAALALLWGFLMLDGCEKKVAPLSATPPVAKKIPHVIKKFDYEWTDNYFWLREKDNTEVIKYLEAENAYTDSIMKHTEPFQDKIYDEILSRIKETDMEVPVKRDDFYYYSRTEEGKEYRIYCRKHGSLDTDEEILLDVNALAEGRDFLSLGIYNVSPNHKLLAYGYDSTGNERYTLRIKNLETGELLPDELTNLSTRMQWANDNRTFFYAIPDDAWRPYKIFRHKLGENPQDDAMIYHEQDDKFWINIGKTKDYKYISMTLGSQTSTEVHFLDADKPDGKFRIIEPRKKDHEYYVGHHGGRFYIKTNHNAKNFKIVSAPVASPSMENWEDFIPHNDSVMILSADLFKDFMALYYRESGLKHVQVINMITDDKHDIEFPESVYVIYQGDNPDFNSKILRFTYESMITPESVYDYDMDSRKLELKKQREVLGGYNPDEYETIRVFVTADDGAEVPLSMVYKRGMVKNGNTPLLLSGYGAYGISSEPYFSSVRLSLLDRGAIYAKAHVRGGGEMGRQWYDDGKLLNKKNTFTDFIDCAEYLVNEKYTSSDKLIITGGSAGGLLIGAVVNMEPELFLGAVAGLPFVDIINTMLDESIPLTVIEYDEWGNPNEKKYFDCMMSYSPYDNVDSKEYPHMLVQAGLHDTRVHYWEPAKWTAKLRELKTDNNRLLLKTEMGAGHGGKSGRYQRIEEMAFEYAFIFDLWRIAE